MKKHFPPKSFLLFTLLLWGSLEPLPSDQWDEARALWQRAQVQDEQRRQSGRDQAWRDQTARDEARRQAWRDQDRRDADRREAWRQDDRRRGR